MRNQFCCLILASLVLATQAYAAELPPEAPFTPAQAAFFKAEARKADDRFVREVARITGSSEASIRKAMPAEGRISNPAVRVVTTLEHERGAEFPEAIRAQVDAAEAERRKAVAAAREAARRH